MIPATIVSIREASPTVKVFRFDTGAERFIFLPGQWLDFHVEVDGEPLVGGYSMTSSPLDPVVELAVKASGWNPPTRWLHERARVGDRVVLDGGYGACTYRAGDASALLLIAGGIGITPLMSILRYAHTETPDVPLTLLFSAPSADELVYRDEIETLIADPSHASRWRAEWFVTREGPSPRRIDRATIERALATLGQTEATVYLCGPSTMIDEVAATLGDLGVPPERVRFERWW